jgi:hypothetical protein
MHFEIFGDNMNRRHLGVYGIDPNSRIPEKFQKQIIPRKGHPVKKKGPVESALAPQQAHA